MAQEPRDIVPPVAAPETARREKRETQKAKGKTTFRRILFGMMDELETTVALPPETPRTSVEDMVVSQAQPKQRAVKNSAGRSAGNYRQSARLGTVEKPIPWQYLGGLNGFNPTDRRV